jgi:multidrug resistance efflux pump
MSSADRFSSSNFGSRDIRFRFRSDLTTVHNNPPGDEPTVSVHNPDNGRRYVFSEAEYFLCQAADGVRSFREIRRDYQQHYGEIPERELLAFYRRLKVLGLLEVDEAGGEGGHGGGLLGNRFAQDRPGGAFVNRAGGGRPPMAEAGRPPVFGIRLFDPTPLLNVLAVVFYPLKFLAWILAPFLLFAGVAIFQRWDQFAVDFIRMSSSSTLIGSVLAALLVVNLTARLAQAVVIRAAGGEVRVLGVALVFGVLPRFVIDRSSIQDLDHGAQLWVHATPLLARAGIFVFGTLVWITYRQTGTWLPEMALALSQIGFWSFAISAMPLFPSDGLNWLSTYFGSPRLKQRALGSVAARFMGRNNEPEGRDLRQGGVLLFGIAILLAGALIGIGVLLYAGVVLEQRYQGAGVVMVLAIFLAFLMWLLAIRIRVRSMIRQKSAAEEQGALVLADAATWEDGRPTLVEAAVPEGSYSRLTPQSVARFLWAGLVLAGLSLGFLPYAYETGGNFTIMPAERSQGAARTEGEVISIHANEGQWVEKDQLLAVLSPWDEERDLAIARAELDRAVAELTVLKEGAKPEEIALAASQVESARAKVVFREAEAKRAEELVRTGTISQANYEKARDGHAENVAELKVAEANLDLVRSSATESEIEAAEAEVRRLTSDYEYKREQLERTRVLAPTSGRIVTPNVHLLKGRYLKTGDTFVEIEDTGVVLAEIEVPESDIALVSLGGEVRIRSWGFSDRIVSGSVAAVSPMAEEREYGRIVRVKAEVANTSGELRTEMSGFAKIEGAEMPAWKAFTRFFIRFIQVEVWSWIP